MMSQEKQIEEMFNIIADGVIDGENNHGVPTGKTCLNIAQTIYDAGYRKQSEWISVEERLPEQYGLFLIADDKGNMDAATWTKQFGWFSGSNRVKRVTHWMPLPEPPKTD